MVTLRSPWSGEGSEASTPGRFLFVLLVSPRRYHLGSRVLSSVRPSGEIWSSLGRSEETGEETAREGAQ